MYIYIALENYEKDSNTPKRKNVFNLIKCLPDCFSEYSANVARRVYFLVSVKCAWSRNAARSREKHIPRDCFRFVRITIHSEALCARKTKKKSSSKILRKLFY